ncbi:hypothetical protein LEL_09021 [Akanthomyces lecanii RCEF 1005]|uniref:Adhesin domain-containing protein n=1 Tax=Akanthomyces lecanii RCEF 1005 TaxID=1081108 RepID=A0A168CTU6_CORDF|nr:hypothetical protein LEL_09021 [Akanthomyces lecanii RCEF 1005]
MATHPDQDLYADDSVQNVPAEESEAFSPTDGYFQPSVDGGLPSAADGSSGSRAPSHAVPQIPDVLVADPTLSEPSSAKETEALQNVQQDASISEDPLAESVAQSSHRPQDAAHYSAVQNSHRDTAEGFDVSDSDPNLDAPIGRHRQVPQHASPIAATRYNQSGPMRPTQPIDAPPAYSSTRSHNYGTMEPEIPSLTSTEDRPSARNESEPLLPSRTASIDDTPEIDSTETTNKSLLSNKRSTVYFCMIMIITAVFSSLVTAGIILLPSAFKNEAVDAEPISEPDAEPPLVWEPPAVWKCRETPYRIGEAAYPVPPLGRESVINIVEEAWSTDSKTTAAKDVKVFGDIVVRSSRGLESPAVSFDGFSNDPSIRPRLNINSGHLTQTYYLTGPPSLLDWPDDGSSPCYQGRITLWLPAGTTYKSSALVSEHFNVVLTGGLNVSTTDDFVAVSDDGNIVAPHIMTVGARPIAPYRLQSPNCLMVSGMGSVRGWFPLYNRLTLASGSGDVSAQVGLKPLDLLHDSSAELVATSRKGSVNLTAEPPQRDRSGGRDGKFPLRDYASVIQTRAGNITAQLTIGSRTEIETVSGNTKLDLQPILGFETRTWTRFPMLNTMSETGDAQIRVREPIWTDAIKFLENDNLIQTRSEEGVLAERTSSWSHRGFFTNLPIITKPILSTNLFYPERPNTNKEAAIQKEQWGNFETRHTSNGGNLLVTYPDSWTGLINWQGTESGRVSFIADEITILRQWGSPIKHIEARRGTGRSVVNLDNQGGAVILAIGREIAQNGTELLLSGLA